MDQENQLVTEALLDEINVIFDMYVQRSSSYQRGYNDAHDGGNSCPFRDSTEVAEWTKGHRDGVLVQRYFEGEFD